MFASSSSSFHMRCRLRKVAELCRSQYLTQRVVSSQTYSELLLLGEKRNGYILDSLVVCRTQ